MMLTTLRRLAMCIAVGIVAVAGVPAETAHRSAAAAENEATDKAPRSTKLALTPESLPSLLELIRPHDAEWRHLRVEWLTDVVAARKRAAEEDKPIIICYTGGAGYNEPLGVC